MPVDDAPDAPTVELALKGNDTLLAQVKDLVRLRLTHPALGAAGLFTPLYAEAHQYPFVYSRSGDGEIFVIALNPSARSANADFAWTPGGEFHPIRGDKVTLVLSEGRCRLEMPPLSYCIGSCIAQK